MSEEERSSGSEPTPENNAEVPKGSIAAVYEHLFPNQKWQELPPLQLADVDFVLRKCTVDIDSLGVKKGVIQALIKQEGFAGKIDFTPSKFRVWAELQQTEETDQKIHRIEFDELLKPNETVGNVARKFLVNAELEKVLLQNDPKIREILKPLYIVGIVDRDSRQPIGVIYYIEGPRDKGGKRKLSLSEINTQLQEQTI